MKFIQTIIEKISILYKNFYYRGTTCRNILTYPDSTYQARHFTSPLRVGGGFQYYKLETRSLRGVGEVASRVPDALPEYEKKFKKN